jgi:hypothetical protein
MIRFITFLSFFGVLFGATPNYAAWAERKECPTSLSFDRQVEIKKDGSSEDVVEIRITILNEEGREENAIWRSTYNADVSTLKILEAKTIFQGKAYPVLLDKITDKPLANSNIQGFDQLNQVAISFPKVEIGSVICIKYKLKNTRGLIDNFYSGTCWFGGGYVEHCSLSLHSELPLYMSFNDPLKVLEIKKDKDQGFKKLTIKQLKPLCHATLGHSEFGVLNPGKQTWVVLSSTNSWTETAKLYAPPYEKVLNQSVPQPYKDIIERARTLSSDVDRLNLVTSFVSERIQYMTDMRTIKGRLCPHDLTHIVTSGLGDCKDFSVLTGAILKALGYKVQPALVIRGRAERLLKSKVPCVHELNHVFLKVTNDRGQVFWIDPTNFVSMAQNIMEDVADKDVLILDSKNPSFERSPKIDPHSSEALFTTTLDLKDDKVLKAGVMKLQGYHAVQWTGLELRTSKSNIEDILQLMIAGHHISKESKRFWECPSLTSRVVQDITFKFNFEDDQGLAYTNLGPALKLWILQVLDSFIESAPNQVKDLFVGPPRLYTEVLLLKNRHLQNPESVTVNLDSPWLSIKRSCQKRGSDTEITTQTLIKETFIPSEELQKETYKNLKRALVKNFTHFMMVLNK